MGVFFDESLKTQNVTPIKFRSFNVRERVAKVVSHLTKRNSHR